MMRHGLALCPLSLALLLAAGNAVTAQTPAPAATAPAPMTKAALRHQDRADCNKEAARLLVPKPEMANFVRNCMADRQGERKAGAKAKAK